MTITGRRAALAAAVGLTGLALSCGPRSVPADRPDTSRERVPVMGPARLTAAELASWFNERRPRPGGVYGASVPIETLARYFIEEGATENVAGDLALMQSIVETGWFRFGGSVPASSNNFAGIGASRDGGGTARFPDARTGVRAQIQHLRAYADARALTCSVPPLRHPCVDPRFHLVHPKGRAPTWNTMGNGNWASSRAYAASILRLYAEARTFTSARRPGRVDPDP